MKHSCKIFKRDLLKKFKILVIVIVFIQILLLFNAGCAKPTLEIRIKEPRPTALAIWDGAIFLTETGDVYTSGRDRTDLAFRITYLGQGEGVAYSEEPVKILSDAVKIDLGYALKKNGELWVWGTNHDRGIGLPKETEIAYEPVLLMTDVVDFDGNCALKSNGELWGWYWTAYRDPVTGEPDSTTPVKIAGGVKAFCNNAFIKQDGSLWIYGNFRYQSVYYAKPVKTADDVISCSVQMQSGQVLYIKSDGSLWGFGNNEYGQVGNGEYGDMNGNTYDCVVSEPVKIMDDIAQVYAKDYCTFAVQKDGTLWGWGRNFSGMLGTDHYFEPDPVIVTDRFKGQGFKELYFPPLSPSVGYITDNDDTLWGWGYMPVGDGQGAPLGIELTAPAATGPVSDNPDTYLKEPVKVLDNIRFIVGNTGKYRIALAKDGTYYRWGQTAETVKTYGEANVIKFGPLREDGTLSMTTGVWSSLIDTGYKGELGEPDEEITGGIGYYYSQILIPEPCEFPG